MTTLAVENEEVFSLFAYYMIYIILSDIYHFPRFKRNEKPRNKLTL